jgi:hypothetical protein
VDGTELPSGLMAGFAISSFEIPDSFNVELVISVPDLNRFRTRLC